MVAGDGGGILAFTICSEGCPFWVEPEQKENGARTKCNCPFWVAAGGGVGSRLDLLKGISYKYIMKVLDETISVPLKKELRKMSKRNRKIYMKNIRDEIKSGHSFSYYLNLGNPYGPSNLLPRTGNGENKCEPLPNLSKIEGTYE